MLPSAAPFPAAPFPAAPCFLRNRLLRWLGPMLLIAAAFLIAGATPASAHAVLVDSTPLDAAQLDRLPMTITLRFDESVGVTPDAGRVLDADGRRIDSGAVRSQDNGRRVVIPLRADLADRLATQKARYLVSWRVISADSHVVTGSLRFGVGEPAAGAAGIASTDTRAAVLAAVGAGLGYAGLIAAIGCLSVALLVWRGALSSRPLPILVIGGTAAIVLGALVELAGSAIELGGADGLRTVVDSFPGRMLQARILAAATAVPLALGLLRAIRDHRRARGFTIGWSVVAGGLLIIVAAHGHAAGGELRLVALTATVVHLAAFCCWIGGLLVLVLIIRPRPAPDLAGRVLRQWSPFAFGCVAMLIISGELLGWRQVQPIEALWRTRYGVLLLIKLGLVALTITAALLNQRLIRTPKGLARTALTFVVELSIMVGALGVATALSSTAPAISTYGPPVTATRPMDDQQLRIRVDSTRRGPQTIIVTAIDRSGQPLRLQELTGRLSSDDAGVSAIEVHFARDGDRWRSTDAVAPLPGNWRLQLTADRAQGPAYVVVTDYRVW